MSSFRTPTLSPIDVTVVISQESTGLVHVLSGFAEDSHIDVERAVDTFDSYTGIDNVTTRIFKANTMAKVTVSLQQTSASNDVLSQLYINDKNSRNSSGLFTLTVKDGSGRSIYFAQEAWVGVVPNSKFGSGMNTREWVLQCARMDSFIGGNAKISADDRAAITTLGGTVPTDWQA